MSLIKQIKWHLLLMAALGTLVFLLLYFTVFVTYYAMIANPGQEKAVLDQFAQLTGSPFAFCTAPFVVYLTIRWLCRKASGHYYAHAVLFVILYWVIVMLMFVTQPGGFEQWFSFPWIMQTLLNSTSMMLAALLGACLASKHDKQNVNGGLV